MTVIQWNNHYHQVLAFNFVVNSARIFSLSVHVCVCVCLSQLNPVIPGVKENRRSLLRIHMCF